MKTKLLIFVALVTGILLATAEERPYRPMFEDGHTWITGYTPMIGHSYSICSINSYVVDGDTVIDGINCKRICNYKTGKPVFYGYEEDRKVYVIDPYYPGRDGEESVKILMADFGMSKGDTISIYDEYDNYTYQIPCTDEDYIEVDGEVYRRLNFGWFDGVMIEGIGWRNLRSSLVPSIPIPTDGSSSYLIRSFNKGKVVKQEAFSAPGLPADSVIYNPNK